MLDASVSDSRPYVQKPRKDGRKRDEKRWPWEGGGGGRNRENLPLGERSVLKLLPVLIVDELLD